jgi:acetyl-CoA carboxylase, biotin carboxylase subunit
MPPFKKILVANRGEIAVRVIRACRDLRIPVVAVYSQADKHSLHVKLADEAICIGPPPNKESYLNIPNIMSAALITGSDAIHPGYGNLSEMAAFAENCELCKIKFIGPPAEVITKMQDKAQARQIMKEAGIPVVPGSVNSLKDEAEAIKVANGLGYPVMLKASFGGGGKGIRVVQSEEELVRALALTRSEGENAFGRSEVYLEKVLEEPKHVEFQVLADSKGEVVHLGDRDCSIQTPKHQKLLEESPCIALSAKLRAKMGEAALKAAKAVNYVNAGTVEFLLDKQGHFYFLEFNTRIQVEHPVTEEVTGLDLVKEQVRIAAGEKIGYTSRDLRFQGHAIECRITAEDPENRFLPCAGKIESLVIPGGPGVRVDSHIYAGYVVPPFYDSLLAKLIVWGKDRNEALARMRRALMEFEIGGIKTSLPLHREILANAFFRKGEVYTNFIFRRMKVA